MLATVVALINSQEVAMSETPQDGSQPTVVLVHGAWADGSG
jgi:hypothetical protein